MPGRQSRYEQRQVISPKTSSTPNIFTTLSPEFSYKMDHGNSQILTDTLEYGSRSLTFFFIYIFSLYFLLVISATTGELVNCFWFNLVETQAGSWSVHNCEPGSKKVEPAPVLNQGSFWWKRPQSVPEQDTSSVGSTQLGKAEI